MTVHLTAHSISRSAKATLRHGFSARVLATFDQACDLATPEGDVVALVSPSIGNGPLNIVLQPGLGELTESLPGTPARLLGDALHVGKLQVALAKATVWEPCADWSALRARLQAITTSLRALRSIAPSLAPAASLLAALDTADTHVILSGAKNLVLGCRENPVQLREAVTYLAGRGIGLTPSGDDFLAGLMLWAWLAHPTPGPFCQALAAVAVPRTTTLSAALLRAAARGECDSAWHRLLTTLCTSSSAQIVPPAQQIIAHGATSGADMLAGFLWLTGS